MTIILFPIYAKHYMCSPSEYLPFFHSSLSRINAVLARFLEDPPFSLVTDLGKASTFGKCVPVIMLLILGKGKSHIKHDLANTEIAPVL